MKEGIIRFLQSLVSNPSLFLKIKDTVFCNTAEPFFRLKNYAYKHYLHQLHLPILDIGAANGDMTDYLAKNFPNAPIIGFEPVTKMFELAQKKNSKNKGVTIRNIGLYNSIGKKSIHVTANYLSSSIYEINAEEMAHHPKKQQERFNLIEKQEINTSTLDEETKNLDEILLIKIDTQGSELNILKCGIETLKKTHLILIEMNNHEMYKDACQYYEVDSFLRDNGFRLVDIIMVFRPDGFAMEYDAIYERHIHRA